MPATQRSPIFTFFAATLAVGAIVFFQRQAIVPELREQRKLLEGIAEQVKEIRSSTTLLHFDRGPGNSFENIMAHLRFWTDQAGKLGGSMVEKPHIEKRLQEGLDALFALGPSTYPQVEAAFLAAGSVDEDPLRKILLRAMVKLDPARGAEFAENALRRRLPRPVSFWMRLIAADELLGVDAGKAGEAIKDVLLTESVRGQISDALTGASDYTNVGFFNFVSRFLQSAYPQKEDVLLQMLRHPLHDIPTLQEVMDGLAKLKSKDAVEKLQEFVQTRDNSSRSTPLFRSRAVRTLATILGPEACEYLKQQIAHEKDERVRQAMSDFIKETCR